LLSLRCDGVSTGGATETDEVELMLDRRLEDFDADDRFGVDDSASRLIGTGVRILVSACRSTFFSCEDGRAATT
jgi:hypothetical protein